MTETLWIVVVVAVLFLAALVILWFKGGKTSVEGGGIKASLETHNRPDGSSGGASMKNVKAGGSARNLDRTGKGASMSDVEADGDVENTTGAESGAKRPK